MKDLSNTHDLNKTYINKSPASDEHDSLLCDGITVRLRYKKDGRELSDMLYSFFSKSD